MNSHDQGLLESLKSGFIDKSIVSNSAFHPRLLVNDPSKEQRVLTTIQQELNRCEEFWFSVAFITTSGVASILSTLKTLEDKGIKGRILASQYQNFTQPEALRRLAQLTNIELKISVDRDFHAKGYLFKTDYLYNLIVGSSNLTANALSRNVEWNLKVSAKPDSQLMQRTLQEFQSEFVKGEIVNDLFIENYEFAYEKSKKARKESSSNVLEFPYKKNFSQLPALPSTADGPPVRTIEPNNMQKEALINLHRIREEGQKKALLVSATGTGKTFLSAFDAQAIQAKRLLFVVHRRNIAKASMASFKEIFGTSRTMGLYSGQERETDCDFVFCTIQTLSRSENLHKFAQDHFDYIIIDESHRAGGSTYQRILNYFSPKFLLGMTATPERTDGFDIFKLFDHTIAYEIRLHQALAEDMLSPFHYYGVTDMTVDGRTIDETSDFNLLAAEERVDRVLEQAAFYGTDSGNVRGLVFCSRVEECLLLAEMFCQNGFPSIALTGSSSEDDRYDAIRQLEADDPHKKLDYIFTVDIFNEGVDIPKVNQVIMLRPTQSAIIFVQQMGRGLRIADGKSYLTIIDFIGNYKNNFLVPIALYGDNSYNKDKLRKLIKGGSASIPGTSTINFDKISRDRIFSAIDSTNMKQKRDLVKDYKLLKYQLGRPPMMQDFLEYKSRDPFLYVEYSKSFFNFSEGQEVALKGVMPEKEKQILDFLSKEINNSKRIEEPLILEMLLNKGSITFTELKNEILNQYKYENLRFVRSAIDNLNLMFMTKNFNRKMLPLSQIYNIKVIQQNDQQLSFHEDFRNMLKNDFFKVYLLDSIDYAVKTFNQHFHARKFNQGFMLYQKYSRKDVFRILCWKTNPVAQNVGGYIVSKDKSNCPIFVTYHKAEGIAESTKYEDYFIDNSTFAWMSKSNRTLESNDVQAIRNHQTTSLRMPLFIKKSDDEGLDFYYVGDVIPVDDSFEQTTMKNDNGRDISVVKLIFRLNDPLEDGMFDYLTQE